MKASEIKFDLEKLKQFKTQNAKEGAAFIDWWVKYMKSHSDKEWSKQQSFLINSFIKE